MITKFPSQKIKWIAKKPNEGLVPHWLHETQSHAVQSSEQKQVDYAILFVDVLQEQYPRIQAC
jgi:hypothetical protein